MQVPTFEPHPLKKQIEKEGLTLWQLRKMLGGKPCEANLSRALNGVTPMPKEVEDGLKHILSEIKQPQVSCK